VIFSQSEIYSCFSWHPSLMGSNYNILCEGQHCDEINLAGKGALHCEQNCNSLKIYTFIGKIKCQQSLGSPCVVILSILRLALAAEKVQTTSCDTRQF